MTNAVAEARGKGRAVGTSRSSPSWPRILGLSRLSIWVRFESEVRERLHLVSLAQLVHELVIAAAYSKSGFRIVTVRVDGSWSEIDGLMELSEDSLLVDIRHPESRTKVNGKSDGSIELFVCSWLIRSEIAHQWIAKNAQRYQLWL